ncbi:MAG: GAF domain-containing protein [Mycobacteriales bacterium]
MADDADVRQALRTVAALASELGPALAPDGFDALLGSIATMARQAMRAAVCSIVLIEGDELVIRVASGEQAELVIGARLPVGEGVAGWVLATGQALGIDDVGGDERFAKSMGHAGEYHPTAVYAVPLVSDRETVGVIQVLDPADELAATALTTLEPYAYQAALAVQTGEAFDHLGQVLFRAAAAAVDDDGVAEALREIAASAPPSQASLAGMAADLAHMSRLGPRERAAASEMLSAFAKYVDSREP